MPKKTQNEIEKLFAEHFNKVKGDRTHGWDAHDSQEVAMHLITAQTDKDGKEVKLGAERIAKINAAMLNAPKRIVDFIKDEVESAGAVMDHGTEEKLLWLMDLPKVRADLTAAGIFEKMGKGKKTKAKLTDLLKK